MKFLKRKGTVRETFEPLARWSAQRGMTPNALTWGGCGLALVAGILAAFGCFGWAALVGGVSGLCDVLDGTSARVMKRETATGAVLDSTLDRYSDAFLLLGITLFYSPLRSMVFLTFLALMGSFLMSYSTAKAEAIHLDPPRSGMKRESRWIILLVGLTLSSVGQACVYDESDVLKKIQPPLAVALLLVALFSNISAAVRLRAVVSGARREKT